jgi:ribosomal protein S18 acetylase RimI-like enzyme
MDKTPAYEIIQVPVPILRSTSWLNIEYPKDIDENGLIVFLKQNKEFFINTAKEKGIVQIKVKTPWDWANLNRAGFIPTTGYLTCDVESLEKIPTNTKFSILPVNHPEDLKQLIQQQYQYHYDYMPEYFTVVSTGSVQRTIKGMSQALKEDNGFVYGVMDKGEYRAFIDVDMSEDHAEINNVYVSQSYRNKGVATALIARAAHEACQRNVGTVALFTGYNQNALKLYLKLDFKKEYLQWIINV